MQIETETGELINVADKHKALFVNVRDKITLNISKKLFDKICQYADDVTILDNLIKETSFYDLAMIVQACDDLGYSAMATVLCKHLAAEMNRMSIDELREATHTTNDFTADELNELAREAEFMADPTD